MIVSQLYCRVCHAPIIWAGVPAYHWVHLNLTLPRADHEAHPEPRA